MPAVNSIISKADYNSLRDTVINVIGSGSGSYGYGQAVKSSAVTEDSKVTINEWTNLKYDLINIAVHQTGSIPSLVSLSEGNTVRYDPAGITAPLLQFSNLASTLSANRFNVVSSQYITNTKGSISQTWPGTLGSYWRTYIYTTVTVRWSSASSARAFFNSGGQIRFSSSRTGGSALQQNTIWSNFLTSVGTVGFGGNTASAVNYYSLTNSFQQYFKQFSTGSYSSNYFKLSAKCNSVSTNTSGSENQLIFLIEWEDDYVPGPTWLTPDKVDGTMTLNVSTLEAYGVLQPSGTFSVESPTVTLGTIAQSA